MARRPFSPRTLHLTEAHVARVTRPVPEFSYPSTYAAATEADYARLVDRLVTQRSEGPLYIFAYGSLIWKPTFEAVVSRRAVARGWHRQFALVMRGFRATPEAPGLMMTLMPGGRCVGLALEVAAGAEREVLDGTVRREFSLKETMAYHRWLRLDTEDGPLRGLVFWAGPTGPGVQRGLGLDEAAHRIARACGPRGSNAEYLRNTVAALEAHGIGDRNLWTLQRLVASEIDVWLSEESRTAELMSSTPHLDPHSPDQVQATTTSGA